MKAELQNKLFKKYPKIFRQKDLSIQQTLMCWGICCGDGWYNIIDNLCSCIQARDIGVEAVQVKEKFGGLRFYVDGSDDYTDGLISMAVSLSYCTCETCGNVGKPNERGWITTLCESCREEENTQRNLKIQESMQLKLPFEEEEEEPEEESEEEEEEEYESEEEDTETFDSEEESEEESG